MVAWDQGRTLAVRFRAHAGDATHLYGHLMRAMAEDWEAGGVTRRLLAGYEHAPHGSALPLRLLGGVFRLVLTGRTPALVRFYPCLGGEDDPAGAWPVVRPVLEAHLAELRRALEVPPQTNEVGRSAALLAGLFDVVGASGVHRVRLLEVGASAGLNLLVDRFGFRGAGWAYGPEDSPVRFVDPIDGPVRTAPFTLVERRGCDLHPVDATSASGRLLLTSFVWPFDVERHRRLTAALVVAAEHPPVVDEAPAGAWLDERLTGGGDDVLTVVWNSVTRLYWPEAEVAAVDRTLAEFGAQRLLARVSMEFGNEPDASPRPELRTTLWRPGQDPRHVLLGTAHDHGVPVRLKAG